MATGHPSTESLLLAALPFQATACLVLSDGRGTLHYGLVLARVCLLVGCIIGTLGLLLYATRFHRMGSLRRILNALLGLLNVVFMGAWAAIFGSRL